MGRIGVALERNVDQPPSVTSSMTRHDKDVCCRLSFSLVVAGILVGVVFVSTTATEAQAPSDRMGGPGVVPGIRYVAPGGDCEGATPCDGSIQHAVDAAAAGDEIRVAAGTYTGSGEEVVHLAKSLVIRGGYATSDWDISDPEANPTTLDGQNARGVVRVSGGVTPTLYGLRVTGGQGNAGGGIRVDAAGAVIDTVEVLSNSGKTGAGIACDGGHVTVVGGRVAGNTADGGAFGFAYGGGVYLRDCDAALRSVIIEDNTATGNGGGGGGVYADRSDLVLTGARLEANEAGRFCSGGGCMPGAVLCSSAATRLSRTPVKTWEVGST